MDERAKALSTGDFIRELDYEKLILSAESILQSAAVIGNVITKKREQVPQTQEDLLEHLKPYTVALLQYMG